MINLEPALSDAVRAASSWTPHEAWATAHRLAVSMLARVDWDAGAGESWMRLMYKDEARAFVSIKAPLIVLKSFDFQSVSLPSSIIKVIIDDFNDEVFFCNPATLESAFSVNLAQFHSFNPCKFSISDLWYATV